MTVRCCVCQAAPAAAPPTVSVRSNVRAHRDERFPVWRCDGCGSVHAATPVDLDHYYRDYPFLRARPSRVTAFLHRRLWRRLRKAGVGTGPLLDHGCGAGHLVEVLRGRGVDAHGYDAYHERFRDPAALARTYDTVLSQDVIEHVDDPLALLGEFDRRCRPGGIIAIGTPDAAALDLTDPERDVHSLHQPFHRHILTATALRTAGEALGWTVLRRYTTSYTNTPVPTLNVPYLLRYLRAGDDTLDVAFDPPRFHLAMISPLAIFDALFGALRCRPTDGMTIFRKPD